MTSFYKIKIFNTNNNIDYSYNLTASIYSQYLIPIFKYLYNCKIISNFTKLLKINISTTFKSYTQNLEYIKEAIQEIYLITGQVPYLTKPKKNISNFNLSKNKGIIGATVNLNKKNKYIFLEKLITLILPKIKDFNGLSYTQFDKYGNFHFRLTSQYIFPEISILTTKYIKGFNIIFNLKNKNLATSKIFLNLLNFPLTF
uniref:Ribosomal protein L5 n=1 Tax=Spumella sp. NIES-1846 TaxID=2490549 RepID=A0A455RFZ2_9STRA|nr:ribosomal protein L5 [Spumella sp. NIES-1846]